MTNEKQLRLFVAVEVPDEWKQALAKLQDSMQAALAREPVTSSARLRWVRPEGMHITLKFIGGMSEGRLRTIQEQLSKAVTEQPGIQLALGRAGSFEEKRAPRVVLATIETPHLQRLHRLAESIETWLEAAGVPRDRRRFTPHVTLARLPDGLSDEERRRIAEVTNAVPFPKLAPFVVDSVSLMQSFLEPGGARYVRLSGYPVVALQPEGRDL
jgi:RNA 2',3'-cyclic 3'-phosphodiesterase